MRVIPFSAVALLLCSACGASDASLDAGPSGGSGSGSGGSSAQQVSLAFVGAPRALVPREALLLTVQVSPPGEHLVRFALPANDESNPLDAVLDRSEADTDASGRASALLLAPTSTTAFKIRASVEGTSTELPLDVVESGYVTIEVQPIPTGQRTPTTWVATARFPGECGPAIPSPDGPEEFTGYAPAGSAPEILDVPIDDPEAFPMAITLRSGHYMGGCTTIEAFTTPPQDGRYVVRVTVLDRPIELLSSRLSLSLGLESAEPFKELTELAGADALVAVLGSSSDDADALLDTMRATLDGVPRQELDSARKAEGWDDLVRQHWGQGAGTRLRDRVAAWLARGTTQLVASENLLEAELVPVDMTSAELLPVRLAGLEPTQAGLVSSALVSWSAAADDTVVLGTDVYLSSSRLATGLAEQAAIEDFPQATGAPAALAEVLDCGTLSLLLSAAGSDSTEAYPGCDAECLSELCRTAANTLWQRGREVRSSQPTRLALNAAGKAHVGDAAEIAGISGTWVGELSGDTWERSTGGELSAVQP
jgi:hypothetical protein